MPGCAAVGCSNSAKKGFLMKRFPRDAMRRKQWLIKMKRIDWTPTDYSCLCEIHFPPEMWEKTKEDGARKLKFNAFPTIFSFSQPKKLRKFPAQRNLTEKNVKFSSGEVTAVEVNIVNTDVIGQSTSISVENISDTSQSSSSEENDTSTVLIPLETNNREIIERLSRYEKMFLKERQKVIKLKKMLRNSNKKLRRVEKIVRLQPNSHHLLQNIFNDDQITALRKKQAKKSTKLMKWSNQTITKSLKLKFSCGNNGYKELLNQGFPLPSIRTLQRRLQNLNFDSGILYEVFEFLKIKVNTFAPHERDCALVLDEMAISPGTVFDLSLNKYFGNITLPHHTGLATHVLVFMLGGVTTRWKQVVAYYFTGDSVNGAVFKNIVETIFQNTNNIGLNIISVTSDMGSCNQALWKVWGISAGKYSPIQCKISHPLHKDENVFVFADVPHLFKNIKSMLLSNKIIQLPNYIVDKHNLPTHEVLASHIYDVVSHQETHTFKLAPKLCEEDLLPTHFKKMKVSTSTNVISHSVSSALKFLSVQLNKPAYLTTAWFLDQIEKWFYLMTSRHPSCALSKFNLEQYDGAIVFLNEFRDLFSNIQVGYKKMWKPSQTGVLISTQSIIDIQKYLLEERDYKFILTSRFSQDCLENLFCVMRSKQIVPNAVQVKNNLKLICVSQYLKNASTGSYDEDDREFLSGFLETFEETKKQYDNVQLPNETVECSINLNYSELNSLYNICGYILQSISKTSKICQVCLNAAGSKTPVYRTFTKFSLIKRFKENSLFFCNEFVFYFFLDMENIFRKFIDIVSTQNIDLKEFFFQKMSILDLVDVPNCHKLKKKIVKRFIIFRLKINSKKSRKATQKHASKSVAGNML